MREVLYRNADYTNFEHTGWFHCWIVVSKQDHGNGTFALVELEDGTVQKVKYRNIKFLNRSLTV